MTTSGTTSFSVTELDIITDALTSIGVAENSQTLDADDVVVARRKLNMLMKQWTGQADFAPGLKMWTRRRGYLFLQKSQAVYSLGPTGDECAAESYVGTTLSAGAAANDGTVTLTSISGIATAMRVGILLDSGFMQWTTVNGAPVGQVVTLTATLTGAASAGNVVYAYTSKIQRPFEIVTAVRRDSSGNDSPMDPNLSLGEYEAIPSKAGSGTPSSLYFEARRTNAAVSLDVVPSDLTNVIRLVYLAYPEDTSIGTQDMDFPAEWFRPLSAQLAIDCAAGPFRRPVTPEMKLVRDESLKIAQNAYPAKSVAYFQSEPDCY